MKKFIFVLALFAAFVLSAQDRIPARVSFTSHPSGAIVFVDGARRGSTPLILFDLAPGRHHVKYVLPGYIEEDDFVDTDEGPIVDRSVMLEEEKGLLLLKTDPEGCHIKVNGIAYGETPRFINHLTTKDTHTIRLSKPGYRDHTISVKFNGREPVVREEKLMLDSGVVNVLTDPAGAEVTVNGIVRGVSPLLVREIPKGTTTVKFKLEGYEEDVRELRMNAGEQQTLSVTLKALPGTMHLIASPETASFYVDGQPRGRGPLTIPGLKPGAYEVRCEAEGFATEVRTIRIENGKSVREEFKLTNVMGSIDLRSVPGGADVFLDGRKVGTTKGVPGGDAMPSELFTIGNVMEGEHTVVVRKAGFHESVRTVEVKSRGLAHLNRLTLRRAFIPNVEIETMDGHFRGIFKTQDAQTVVIETSPGLDYPIPRRSIRKISYLTRE